MAKRTYETVIYENNAEVFRDYGVLEVKKGQTIYLDAKNIPYIVLSVVVEGNRQIVDAKVKPGDSNESARRR